MGQNFHKIEAVRLEGGDPLPPPSGPPDRFLRFFLTPSLKIIRKIYDCACNHFLFLSNAFQSFRYWLKIMIKSEGLMILLPTNAYQLGFCSFSSSSEIRNPWDCPTNQPFLQCFIVQHFHSFIQISIKNHVFFVNQRGVYLYLFKNQSNWLNIYVNNSEILI